MVVMAPRQTWTDERLDEFKASANQRFDKVDKRFDQIDKRLGGIDADIRELRQSIERMNDKMTAGFIALAGLIVSSQFVIVSSQLFF
jgi:chromosome segregation ATPase